MCSTAASSKSRRRWPSRSNPSGSGSWKREVRSERSTSLLQRLPSNFSLLTSFMFTDLRPAGRLLLKAPGFALLVVAVLAIGIGATTSIFSVVNGVLLEPLPFPEADRLIAIQSVTQGDDGTAS